MANEGIPDVPAFGHYHLDKNGKGGVLSSCSIRNRCVLLGIRASRSNLTLLGRVSPISIAALINAQGAVRL